MVDALSILALLAGLGCGLIAGVFFAFSSFVMKALDRLPAAQGMAAMQSINVVVLNRSFLGVFVGTAALCAVAVGAAILRWGTAEAPFVLAGGLFYLAGCFLVTMAFNVPRNEALAPLAAEAAGSADAWAAYVPGWTAWNTVRTIGSLDAAAAFGLALAA